MSPHKVSTLSSLQDVSSYDISPNGFLPSGPPLAYLPDGYYQPWDNIIHYLPTLLDTKQLRSIVEDLHVLSTSHLHSDAEWQRAYLVLTMIAQAYIWQGPEPSEVRQTALDLLIGSAYTDSFSAYHQPSPFHS